MSISFVAQANNVANAASITINTPAGVQAGDLLIAGICNFSNSDVITTPAGWNLLERWDNGVGGSHLTIFWKIAGASEPTSTTFTGSVSTRRAGFIAAYRGVNQANPWNVYGTQLNYNSLLHPTPSITPSRNGCMIVGIVGLSTDTPAVPPSGWTARVGRGTTNAYIAEADILQSTAQAISGTFTTFATTHSIAFIGALAPRATYQRRANGNALGLATASSERSARRQTSAQALLTGTAAPSQVASRQAALTSFGQGQATSSQVAMRGTASTGVGHASADASVAYPRGGSYFGLGFTGAEQTRTGVRRLLAAGNAASSSAATRVANRRMTAALHGVLAGALSISRTYVAPQYYTYADASWRTPEVVLAAGPRNVGDAGDGSYAALYGYAYVGAIVDGVFRLWQLHNASGLPYSLAGDSPVGDKLVGVLELPLPEGARHLALAFDQAAREVIAYEVDEQTYVRQWDPAIQQYTLRGPFPGVDPVLINDATVGYFPPDSDVLLFHLTPDRKTLVMRVQRELYDNPHTIQTFETPVVLDQAVALPYQIELLGSLASILDATGYALRSQLYPVYLSDAAGQLWLEAPATGSYTPEPH